MTGGHVAGHVAAGDKLACYAADMAWMIVALLCISAVIVLAVWLVTTYYDPLGA